MTAVIRPDVAGVFYPGTVTNSFGGVSNKASYQDRENLVAYAVGAIVKFAGKYHRCVVAGPSGGAEPIVIAPLISLEMIANGTFDTDTTGWAAGAGTPVITWVDGAMKVAFGTAYSSATQTIATTIGRSYLFKAEVVDVANSAWVAKADDASYLVNREDVLSGVTVPTVGATVITATATTTYLHAICELAGSYNTVDNISWKEVTLDGTCAWETVG
jgi:hypothetical protein